MEPSVGPSPDPFDRRPFGLSDRVDDLLVGLERWRNRVPPSVAVGVVAAIGALVWWWSTTSSGGAGAPIDDLIPTVVLETTTTEPDGGAPSGDDGATGALLVVHVAGAVAVPGVYTFGSTDRVVDAVEAAGGALPDADLSALNLAAPLVDGAQVRVPMMGEVPVAPLVPHGAGGSEPTGPVDLNTATVDELDTLPGVGPATAQAIVDWRDANGRFSSVDELLDVPGIGPSKLERIAPGVIVG